MDRQLAREILSLQLDWVRAADSKVSPVFATDVAMLGVIAALIKTLSAWTITAAVFTSISCLLLLGSVAMLALVSFPRTGGPKGSKVFFGGISQQDENQYLEALGGLSEEDLVKDIVLQAHRNAEIANDKYTYLKLAFMLMFSAMPFWLIAIYYLYG